MNPNYMEHRFPQIKPIPLQKFSKNESRLHTVFNQSITIFTN